MEIQRIVTVPIIVGDVAELKNISAAAARFANELLTEKYLLAKKLPKVGVYRSYNDVLAASLRDAMNTECESVWGKFAKRILAGHMSLPLFSSDRCLSVRCDKGHPNVRVIKTTEGYNLRLKLLPKTAAPHEFPVFQLRLKKDIWLGSLLSKIAAGELACTGAKIVFSRKNHKKIMARIGYKTEREPLLDAGNLCARIGPLGENGELAIRIEGPAYNFEDRRRLAHMTAIVQRMQSIKQHCEGIWNRVRMSKKRNAMQKLKRFEQWADGPCHELSRKIVNFLRDRGVTKLEWLLEGGELPWAKIRFQVEYKGEEFGLEVVDGEKAEILKTKGDLLCAIQTKKALREARKALKTGVMA